MKLLKESNYVAISINSIANGKSERRLSVAGLGAILLGLGALITWAGLAPLAKGVPITGTVTTDFNRKPVQYLSAGVVTKVFVHDGDPVEKGQPLAKLDTTQLDAAYLATRILYVSQHLTEARIEAELRGSGGLILPSLLNRWRESADVIESLEAQRSILSNHRISYDHEIGGLIAGMKVFQAKMTATEQSKQSKLLQLASLSNQLTATRKIVDDGYYPLNRFLELQRSAQQLEASVADDTGTIETNRQQYEEAKKHLDFRRIQYRSDLESQLADIKRDVESNSAKLVAQETELAQTIIRSPSKGIVFANTLFTEGAVVTPGARLMDISPSDEAFVIEGQVPVNLIDRIAKHQNVDVVFAGLNSSTTPRISGEIVAVSPDRSVDERTMVPYFKVRVKLRDSAKHVLMAENLTIQSGMSADLIIQTGERTFLSYLLKPIIERSSTGLMEE